MSEIRLLKPSKEEKNSFLDLREELKKLSGNIATKKL